MKYTKICSRLTIFSIFLFTGNTALAQSDIEAATKQSKLQELSIQWKQRSEAAQKHAKDQAKRKGWPTRKELVDGTLIEIQRLSPAGKPIYYMTENIDAADTVSTDEVWAGGSAGLALDGSGLTVGEWDGAAVLATHQEFQNDQELTRVTQVDGAATTHYHATHVAGTLIASGVDNDAKGMSPAAYLDAYDWNSAEGEMAAAASNLLLLSNHSYGTITGWFYGYPTPGCKRLWSWFGDINDTEDYNFGFYDGTVDAGECWGAKCWDQIAFDAPFHLIVKSAGNDRSDAGPAAEALYCVFDGSSWTKSTVARDGDCGPDGYDCISTTGTAKNILTVGAVDDITDGYLAPGASLVSMSSFSGWGPTDDGRIKPDIVANGISLYSTFDGNSTDYGTLSGTSMAAPNATGSLLLLQQHYQNTDDADASMRAATLKAVVIHTADEAGAASGPDYAHGWGLLNTKKAAELISANGGTNHRIIEATLSQGETYEVWINSGGIGSEIKATLVWTDPPGTPVAAAVGPTDLMLVNDLDLRVIGDSTISEPWILNPANPAAAATTDDNFRDNVEQVLVPLSDDGDYTIQVSHKEALVLVDDEPQAFSLIISNSVCGNGYALPANQWRMISLPCAPAANSVSDLFADDLNILNYAVTWILYERDEGSNTYVALAADSPISQGQGYWIYSLESTTLDVEGSATPLITLSSGCPSPSGCFEIPLTPGINLFNLAGHPFPYSVNWADARIRVNSDVYTPSGAPTYFSKEFHLYNGNSYDTYDDSTPGMEGVLGVYDGFWVEVLNTPPFPGELTLLIPPTRASEIIMASQNTDTTGTEGILFAAGSAVPERHLAAKMAIWWNFWTDLLIPQAHAAPQNFVKKIPAGLAKRDAHRAMHKESIASQEEWYIRLTAEAPAEGMKDRGNVLGQLQDSEYAYDLHDLKELTPFGNRYLTIVFPHPDWNEYANDYASDFHPVSKKNRSDSWTFEVRTDDPAREVSLSWAGPAEAIGNAWLIDEATGEMIEVASEQKHVFIMGATSRTFTWHYSGKGKIKDN